MPDEIIRELWEIKDNIARQHGYDLETLVAHLRARKAPEAARIADLRTMRRAAEQGGPGEVQKPRP